MAWYRWKFLEKLGNKKDIIDLGKVFERLLLPVRTHFKPKKIKLSQEVACLVLGGKWRNPHLSQNDALMLKDSFEGLAKLLAAHC